MFTLFILSIYLFFIFLTGWTVTTYFIKKNSQKIIREELKNSFEISKEFFISLKKLIEILAINSFSSKSNETNLAGTNVTHEDPQPLSLVEPIKEVEEALSEVLEEDEVPEEDFDTALTAFSPEVVEVINEEEEKVA